LALPERSELDAALLLGGWPAVWRMARGRLLRLGMMALAAVATLVVCEPEVPALLGVSTFAEEFLSQIALAPSGADAAALGWPLMALALLCTASLACCAPLRTGAHVGLQTGWWNSCARMPPWVTMLAMAWSSTPLLLLAWGCWRASGRWPAHASSAVLGSLWLAALSSILACVWGWLLSESAARAGAWAGRTLSGVLLLGMWWPSVLTGIALASIPSLDALHSHAPLVLAHTLRALPFATWILLALRQARPPAALEQLALVVPVTVAAWRHIHWPATRPGLIAALALCVGLSLAELTTTVLTVPPGMETVILRLYNLLHYGDQRGVALLALVQATALAALMWSLHLKKRITC
jgi:iron(III) transport system permease protein